jgi:hypothetical protein
MFIIHVCKLSKNEGDNILELLFASFFIVAISSIM